MAKTERRRSRRGPIIFLVLSVSAGFSVPLQARDCLSALTVAAYSHNDYRNDRPLHEAVARGYRGVEADVVLENGRLLVAHSRKETDSSRTLERLYLEPLRDLIDRCGGVYPDSFPFLLNIESKDKGHATYRALREMLLKYEDILKVATNGGRVSPPLQIVLVGWHPPLDEMAAAWPRVAKVQGWISHAGMRLPEGPDELVGLLSLNYGRALRWRGRGPIATSDRKVLAHVGRARQTRPGVPIRAFNVPPVPQVYRVLLDAGIDLIGTEDLVKTREILSGLSPTAK